MCCYHFINKQTNKCYLNGGLVSLLLDGQRLPNAQLIHVHDLASVAVDTPRPIALSGVLSPERRERPYHIGTAVLNQRSRNDLKGPRQRPERPLVHTRDRLGLLLQQLGNLHFGIIKLHIKKISIQKIQ